MVEHMIQFLTEYGYVLLLAWVLAEQFGFPLPAAPVLLAAGALAGSGAVSLPRFLFFDFLGSILWCGTFLGLGYLFRGELEDVALFLGRFKWLLGLVLLVVIPAGYIAFKRRQRQKFIREISMERIEPEELLKRINAGEQVVIVDLRHPLESLIDHTVLPSALRILPEELEQREHEIPRDREVVLYCT